MAPGSRDLSASSRRQHSDALGCLLFAMSSGLADLAGMVSGWATGANGAEVPDHCSH